MSLDAVWSESALKIGHTLGGSTVETTNLWLKNESCWISAIGTRFLNIGVVMGMAIATITNLVCLIFESLAKCFTKCCSGCSERIKELDEQGGDPATVAKITLSTLALLVTSCTLGWFSPAANMAVEQSLREWVGGE